MCDHRTMTDEHPSRRLWRAAETIHAVTYFAEESITARDVLLAEHVGSRLHVCHLSTAGSVAMIAAAKASNTSPAGTPESSSGRTRASGFTFRLVACPLSRRNRACPVVQ